MMKTCLRDVIVKLTLLGSLTIGVHSASKSNDGSFSRHMYHKHVGGNPLDFGNQLVYNLNNPKNSSPLAGASYIPKLFQFAVNKANDVLIQTLREKSASTSRDYARYLNPKNRPNIRRRFEKALKRFHKSYTKSTTENRDKLLGEFMELHIWMRNCAGFERTSKLCDEIYRNSCNRTLTGSSLFGSEDLRASSLYESAKRKEKYAWTYLELVEEMLKYLNKKINLKEKNGRVSYESEWLQVLCDMPVLLVGTQSLLRLVYPDDDADEYCDVTTNKEVMKKLGEIQKMSRIPRSVPGVPRARVESLITQYKKYLHTEKSSQEQTQYQSMSYDYEAAFYSKYACPYVEPKVDQSISPVKKDTRRRESTYQPDASEASEVKEEEPTSAGKVCSSEMERLDLGNTK